MYRSNLADVSIIVLQMCNYFVPTILVHNKSHLQLSRIWSGDTSNEQAEKYPEIVQNFAAP